jgi:acetylglutamate kinase
MDRAKLLIEALPYIKEFYNKFFVIKYGGSAMIEESLREDFCKDIILLRHIGIKPVVIHGGGKQITHYVEKFLGKTSQFRNGLRVTDKDSLEITKMVLIGKINTDIVSLFNKHGGLCCGLSGADSGLITATQNKNLQFTGEVKYINPSIIKILDEEGIIPIIAPLGFDKENNTLLNINADIAAAHIACALKAYKFIILTDIKGIYEDPNDESTFLSKITPDKLKIILNKGNIKEGMIPKVKAGLFAAEKGVPKIHIIDGRIPHSILLELFTDKGIGTLIEKF